MGVRTCFHAAALRSREQRVRRDRGLGELLLEKNAFRAMQLCPTFRQLDRPILSMEKHNSFSTSPVEHSNDAVDARAE